MKLRFDSNLEHQKEAVVVAVNVFEGQNIQQDDCSPISPILPVLLRLGGCRIWDKPISDFFAGTFNNHANSFLNGILRQAAVAQCGLSSTAKSSPNQKNTR